MGIELCTMVVNNKMYKDLALSMQKHLRKLLGHSNESKLKTIKRIETRSPNKLIWISVNGILFNNCCPLILGSTVHDMVANETPAHKQNKLNI